MSAVIDLAKKLLSCPSVTPDEAGCFDVLKESLKPSGFAFEIEKTPNGTTNGWITHGTGAPLFVFAGHIDVVPPGDLSRWTTPPFEPTERNGKLFARGASDMKGSVAAAVVVFTRFIEKHPDHKGTLALLITSDEEGDGLEGTVRVMEKLKAQGTTIDWCIVGEPSCAKAFGDTIKNGRRGSINGKITVHGKLGHVAYPQLAKNPVHDSAAFINELCTRVWDEGTKHFLPTSFQISNIHAGVGAVNVIPAEMTMMFNVRFNTCWTRETIRQEIEAIAQKYNLNADFEWKCSADPFVTEPAAMTEALKRAIAARTGVEAQLNTAGGTSDARFLSRISREIVEFGPMNATIHSIDECVGIDELEGLADIYEDTLEALFETK